MADENYTDLTVFPAEGARVGIATCKRCGAAILFDPREADGDSPTALHDRFHDAKENSTRD